GPSAISGFTASPDAVTPDRRPAMDQAEKTPSPIIKSSQASPLDTSRRGFLRCGAWAGAGLVWTVAGGIPRSTGLGFGEAALADTAGLSFVQISDSHIGFKKEPNMDAPGTFKEAVGKVRDLKAPPAFMIHTGDVSHLSKAEEFDTAAEIIKEANL